MDPDVDATSRAELQDSAMPETVDSSILISNYVLIYIVGHIHQRSREQIEIIVLAQFLKCEILAVKHTLWERHKHVDALDKIIHRVGSASRGSEDANTDDILSALLNFFTLKTPPSVLLNATDSATAHYYMVLLPIITWCYCPLLHGVTAHYYMVLLSIITWCYCPLLHGVTAHYYMVLLPIITWCYCPLLHGVTAHYYMVLLPIITWCYCPTFPRTVIAAVRSGEAGRCRK